MIAAARKKKSISQRELAASIEKEDGSRGIAPAYLNDIEHDRRSPSDDFLIKQFASRLDIDPDYLLLLAARQLPRELALQAQAVDAGQYNRALLAFRRALQKK
jgi:transcriptional regulator with XRE-family HTH domain